MAFLLLLISLFQGLISIPDGYFQYRKGGAFSRKEGMKVNEVIIHKPPYIPPFNTPTESLPLNFSWDNINGLSLVTPVRNQGLPYNCGVWKHFIYIFILIIYVNIAVNEYIYGYIYI